MLLVTTVLAGQVQVPTLLRALSGPSGRVVGAKFVFDETRNRFVFPQDTTLTVYFEWDTPPGDYALTATLRQPDGVVASIAPDVKVQTSTRELNCYWLFEIRDYYQPGIWTIDVRIGGRPAGTHAVEIVGVSPSRGKLTVNEVFTRYQASIVRVNKLDSEGRRIDVSTGFVIASGAVATAFQAIDAGAGADVEFADGRRAPASHVLAHSRLGDWAVLKVDTGAAAPLPRTRASEVIVGSTLVALAVENDVRTVTRVDVRASSAQGIYGRRIQIEPRFDLPQTGAPLVDEQGDVVGILGGSLTPGSRIDQRAANSNPWLSASFHRQPTNLASPITELPAAFASDGRTMSDLASARVLTAPLMARPEFIAGGAVPQLSKNLTETGLLEQREYSVRDDAQIAIYSNWVKKGKVSKGALSAIVYNAQNQPRLTVPSKTVTLRYQESRLSFTVSPKMLGPGYYRVDVCWDGVPAWRVYVRVIE
jgi:hypothetical protein